MITTSYVQGFGGYGGLSEAPSLAQLIATARQRARAKRSGFGRGLGAAFTDDFAGFLAGGPSATFKDADNLVYCNKDAANRPQCQLNAYAGSAAKNGPVAALQRAADRIMNLIPANNLAGRQLRGQVPTGDGTTQEQTFTVPSTIPNPIGSQSGYDGVAGESTMHFGTLALTLAGMLKAFPNPAVSLAFVQPERTDIYAKFASEIAAYLNDVADNFGPLLDAFGARGNVPVQTQLDVATIPFVVPQAAQKSRKGAIIGTTVAMIGLTTIAAISAAKKKPHALYEEGFKPAFGRGGRRHAPRGW
jgi:hypothetical protein